jgi:hypothetical protein
MIVYGDPSFQADLHSLAAELRHCASLALPRSRGWDRLDRSRALLIRAGQLEQALEDASPAHPAFSAVRHATDLAAAALVSDWHALDGTSRAAEDPGPCAIHRLLETLQEVHATPDLALRVKVPEGFAFYTLYPEQYCAAAAKWCEDHITGAPDVLVVGVRSIGTSLSALVGKVLTSRGIVAHRTTLRPTGHPFDRRATLDGAAAASRPTHALIVDEGPGISGSSMAAAAQACEDIGVPADRIAFLPGHGHEPGHAASAVVRECWSRTKRYVVPLADLRWGDRSLPDLLAVATERLIGSPVTHVHDLSAGQWRSRVYPPDQPFPAVCVPFERTKYLVTTTLGASLFWKFAGLTGAADQDFARLTRLAQQDWTPAPVAIEHGFIATSWSPTGGRSTASTGNANGAFNGYARGALARYILDAAGPPLSPDEQRESLGRLREMLYWNAREALGDAAADRANALSDRIVARPRQYPVPRYGDGRLAPHEWLLAPKGHLMKTDCAGHDRDHTIVGIQPLAWDVAGALVEWQLDSLPLPEDAPVDLAELPFYRAAYAAFRLGMCTLCASFLQPGDPDHTRLLEAAERYRADLERTLGIASQ